MSGEFNKESCASVDTVEELRASIISVRERLIDVITEMDNIQLQVIPNIRANYASCIGCWETRLLEAELAFRRAKRRLRLFQAQINEGRTPSVSAVEKQLDKEFEQWQMRVTQELANFRRNLSRLVGARSLSSIETRKLKSLYRTLAKRLHPDLHPSQSSEMLELFCIAKRAYENGQLDVLEALEVSTRELCEEEESLNGLTEEELSCALELAYIQLNVLEKQLEELKTNPIFIIERKLKNPDWIAKTTAQLKQSIDEFDRARHEYEQRLAPLLKEG